MSFRLGVALGCSGFSIALFEAFCAFFTAGCETPKWIAVANSPFYLEFLRIRRLFPGVRVRLDGLFRGRV